MQFDGDNNTDNIRTAGALPAAPCSPALAGLIERLEEAASIQDSIAERLPKDLAGYYMARANAASFRVAADMARQCQASI